MLHQLRERGGPHRPQRQHTPGNLEAGNRAQVGSQAEEAAHKGGTDREAQEGKGTKPYQSQQTAGRGCHKPNTSKTKQQMPTSPKRGKAKQDRGQRKQKEALKGSSQGKEPVKAAAPQLRNISLSIPNPPTTLPVPLRYH